MDGISGIVPGLKAESRLQQSGTKMKTGSAGRDVNQFNSELKEATGQFEEFFLHQMLKEMRKTVPNDGYLKKSQGEEIFNDMLDERYAGLMAKGGGMGLGDFLYDQLKKK